MIFDHQSLIGFDLAVSDTTLEAAQDTLQRLLSSGGIQLPDYGVWGPYEKGETQSRLETAIVVSDLDATSISETMEKLAQQLVPLASFSDYDRTLQFHTRRQDLKQSIGIYEDALDVVISGVEHSDRAARWLRMWWSTAASDRQKWARAMSGGDWVSVKAWLWDADSAFDPPQDR